MAIPVESSHTADIAVVGFATRLPGGASDATRFWDLLSKKRSAFGKVPSDRYNVDAFHHPVNGKLNTLRPPGAHFLDQNVSSFDAPFFNITAQEAKAMDPTARMLLEVTYEGLENAGLPIESLAGSDTSCYVGCFTKDYHEMLMRDAEAAPMYSITGTGFSLFSNRVSWFYDFRGPSLTLDTACSSSLVGLHLACQGLRSGESKVAVVCGANLMLSPDLGLWLSNLHMTSKDGLSKSFAEGASGYGRGEGIAAVILKPLHDALRDGDTIRSVIRGTGVNQDGHTAGITLPNSDAQEDLIRSTYRQAGLDLRDTSYFEAHGTGTAAGDPLELSAVAKTFGAVREAGDDLYVGSVKSNIGHLEGAAGLAGLVKCMLMLEKGVILPNIHFDQPNKRIPFSSWKIQVPTEVLPWPENCLHRASVNSFGYGGTNAHVILDNTEQYLSQSQIGQDELMSISSEGLETGFVHNRMFVFSAPDEAALKRMVVLHGQHLSEATSIPREEESLYLDRLSYTLNERRSQYQWKTYLTASSMTELIDAMSTSSLRTLRTPEKSRLAFVFTGQGAQWAQMGSGLMIYPPFRASVSEADAYLRENLDCSWSVTEELARDASTSRVQLAMISQPLCTVLQIALVELLKTWNIEPTGVIGHSSGEIGAAYCYGALSKEDAWTIAYWRGQVCSRMNEDNPEVKGSMMAAGLSKDAAENYIKRITAGKITVACVNSPASVTISGDETGIDELQVQLASDSIFCRKLKVENAYHSHHMELVAEKYLKRISHIEPKQPASTSVKMASSVTGEVIPHADLGPKYWVKNFVSPVLFADAAATLVKDASRRRRRGRVGESAFDVLLEVGPHGALKGPIRQIMQHHEIKNIVYHSVLARGENDAKSAITAAGELLLHGFKVNASAVNILRWKPSPLVDLPSYPWNHSLTYWAESRVSKGYHNRKHGRHDLLGAPVPDFSEQDPRWRNFIRISEQPWVRDHVVHSSILYPGSGTIAMVLEAVQKLADPSKKLENIELEDVRITKAIVIPDDQFGVETILQLRQQRSRPSNAWNGSWDWTVFSCVENGTLEENSSGLVSIRYHSDETKSAMTGKEMKSEALREQFMAAKASCTRSIDPKDFYDATQQAGFKYGKFFQGIQEVWAGQDRCWSVVNIPDTQSSMPGNMESSHLIHPSTLDVMIHSMFAALGKKGLDLKNAAVPIAFDRLNFSADLPSGVGSQFTGFCHVTRDGPRDLLADIFMSDDAWSEAKVQITGVRCRELPGTDGNSSQDLRAPLGTLEWKPDIDMIGDATLTKYLHDALAKLNREDLVSSDVLTNGHAARRTIERSICAVTDLAAHKDSNLSILQIGGTESLTRSLQLILGGNSNSAARFGSYVVAHSDPEWISRVQEAFADLALGLQFYLFDVDTASSHVFEDNSFDLVILGNDFWGSAQKPKLTTFLQSTLKEGAKAILCDSHGVPEDSTGFGESQLFFLADIPLQSGPDFTKFSLAFKPKPSRNDAEAVCIIEPSNPSQAVQKVTDILASYLEDELTTVNTVTWPVNSQDLKGKSLISLLELEQSVLAEPSPEDFDCLKAMTLQSSRMLWVSMGNDPVMQTAVGYLRVLQNENANLDLRYLQLEQAAKDREPSSIADLINRVASVPSSDREYIEINGSLCINRWAPRYDLGGLVATNSSTQPHEYIKLRDVPASLKLVQPEGNASEFYHFDFDDSNDDELAVDEVEIEVKAIAVNSDDTDSKNKVLRELSGVVTRASNSCKDFFLGRRVCAVGQGSYKTLFRVPKTMCIPMPDDVSFESAATWPLGLATAYHAVYNIGRLRAGQTVLVQAAASAVGQNAIRMLHQIGAKVLATVKNTEGIEVVKNLGVSKQHILLDVDPDIQDAISQITGGKGVSMILNISMKGPSLLQLWNSIGSGGVFIDTVVGDDRATNSFLDMAPFRRGASYSVIDMHRIVQEEVPLMAELLHQVSEMAKSHSPQPLHAAEEISSGLIPECFEQAHAKADVGKVVMTFSPNDGIPVSPRVVNPLSLHKNATYLLVGGLGGLGRSLAKLLVANGARNIAFISRSGNASANAKPLMQELSDQGASATIYACDVTDEQGMREVLGRCEKDLPPIRGVVQAAAVLNDTLFENMTVDQWNHTVQPKIKGTKLLHALLPKDMQFFVMLSSIAGVAGNQGQANYAAGNTYLDALAAYRRQQGQSAVSVDLGLMLGIGMVAERGGAASLKRWEAVGLNEQEFHGIMTAAMAGVYNGSPIPTQIVSGLPTAGILHKQHLEKPFYWDDPRFALLKKLDLDGNNTLEDVPDPLISLLAQCKSAQEAADLTSTALCDRIARGLQTDVGNIDANKSLQAYGVDSLMAVEIRTWAFVEAQAEIALFDVLSGISIAGLAKKMATISKAVPGGWTEDGRFEIYFKACVSLPPLTRPCRSQNSSLSF
ncbi:polyketide synthase [Penicillium capsulatum]|uniref:Polyketide synthase n=1 Tax=Penicillium capsulatum TaxID=69766 RepID=A0A9W9HSJ5_9EURO|nr:polyketide synthase [Penicillium capsulatum]KAJ6106045.1 polyketide synthase [Penicillium capsulatum]